MSNHQIRGDEKNIEIFLGWDPMLNTYYLHVVDASRDETSDDCDVFWIGCTMNEIHDIERIDEALKPYVAVGLPAKLYHDLSKESEVNE